MAKGLKIVYKVNFGERFKDSIQSQFWRMRLSILANAPVDFGEKVLKIVYKVNFGECACQFWRKVRYYYLFGSWKPWLAPADPKYPKNARTVNKLLRGEHIS